MVGDDTDKSRIYCRLEVAESRDEREIEKTDYDTSHKDYSESGSEGCPQNESGNQAI